MTVEGNRSRADHDVSGPVIEAVGLRRVVEGDHVVLDDVTLRIAPGSLIAIVGGSGAGKTTLLEALAGVRPADEGRVLIDGHDLYADLDRFRSVVGFVPQEDIIHQELAVHRTARYAADLRLAEGADARGAAVDEVLGQLGLTERSQTRIRALSGGQRKRASIAVELLSRPEVFFLDEPTSGLDPATSTALLGTLRSLTGSGTTVVFTTHAPADLEPCDQVVFMAPGGRLAFVGTVAQALDHFAVDSLAGVYERLAQGEPLDAGPTSRPATAAEGGGAPHHVPGELPSRRPPGFARQLPVLVRRTFETLVRNRLTLAILLGSPVMIVAMFAVLFEPGAFAFDDPSPSAVVMIVFWIAFGGFFFGLTYGLLQITPEMSIVRRERTVGLNLGAYLVSKLIVLLPFLLLVDVVMLAVLRALGRLPDASLSTYASLGTTLALDAVAALALGLLTSAAVGTVSQATLALPMLCFPAVLFSGAIIPVAVMAPVGEAISVVMPDRWAFEALGSDLGLRRLFAEGGSPLGPPLLEQYGDAGSRSIGTYWSILGGFIVVFLSAAWLVLVRRTRFAAR